MCFVFNEFLKYLLKGILYLDVRSVHSGNLSVCQCEMGGGVTSSEEQWEGSETDTGNDRRATGSERSDMRLRSSRFGAEGFRGCEK